MACEVDVAWVSREKEMQEWRRQAESRPAERKYKSSSQERKTTRERRRRRLRLFRLDFRLRISEGDRLSSGKSNENSPCAVLARNETVTQSTRTTNFAGKSIVGIPASWATRAWRGRCSYHNSSTSGTTALPSIHHPCHRPGWQKSKSFAAEREIGKNRRL